MKANLAQREPEILKHWDEMDLYALLMKQRQDKQLFVLHDGPPYANGKAHMGHALNRILKDFVVRSRSMLGYRTPFVPGWDGHGMPIEHQVARDLGGQAREISKLELRRMCRQHAEKFIDSQRTDFRRLGQIADWSHPYLTISPDYDAAEIGVLREMVEGGYIYRGLRPVLWCAECRTALADAEVEYEDDESPSIYVAFRVNEQVGDAAKLAADSKHGPEIASAARAGKLFALIWTTTPWTLPANLGIALNAGFDYVALKSGDSYYIVAARLAEAVEKECGLKVDARIPLSREALKNLDGKDVFEHPFAGRNGKLMFADYVTLDAGTGLVHTAPGHGYDDFITGNRYGLEPFTPVDDGGIFTAAAGKYAGKHVFAANDEIVSDLKKSGALVHAGTLIHAYAHCWRSKNPLIFRATEQWFMRTDHKDLRARALSEVSKVSWIPKWSQERMKNMLETKPDWCLSRQRAWGVPIPALKCKQCGEVTLDTGVMRRVEQLFATEGSDAWYSRPAADFAGADFKCPKCSGKEFSKEEDILDVWFDSGCSQEAVLAKRPELSWPADVYLEAFEQARGWYQSSLIAAVATRGAAPYRTVVSHGLQLDEKGRKMSKSLGNTGYAGDAAKRLGADVLRLIFASVDYTADMNMGETLFSAVGESYRKIRNTSRFMLGNLFDFEPATDTVAYHDLLEFDRYALDRTERLKQEIVDAYRQYDFQAAYHSLLNFAVVFLSSLYIDVVRDRLYCSNAKSIERRSAQTTLYLILDAFVRMLAPLMPFTSEEAYGHFPGKRAASVHLLEFQDAKSEWLDSALESRWQTLLALRQEALKLLEEMRQAGAIGAPLEAKIRIGSTAPEPNAVTRLLKEEAGQLKELFIVSAFSILSEEEANALAQQVSGRESLQLDGKFIRTVWDPRVVLVGERAPGRKCQRCWMYFDDQSSSDLDPRCRDVLGVTA
jgi:isoleucyl-tRNA synthetase